MIVFRTKCQPLSLCSACHRRIAVVVFAKIVLRAVSERIKQRLARKILLRVNMCLERKLLLLLMMMMCIFRDDVESSDAIKSQ